MNSATQTRKIVLLRMEARYLQARKAVAERGMRFPPYPLLDRYVMRNRVAGIWADELLAHPERNGVFQKGRDVKDSKTGWTVPASDVPHEAFERKGVGLYVVPQDSPHGVKEEKGRVVIHPRSVLVLDGMIRASYQWVPGKPHAFTRIPLVVSPEEFEHLPENEKRWFYRIGGEGVRPQVRGYYYGWDGVGGRVVDADCRPDCAFRVAGVLASEAGAP